MFRNESPAYNNVTTSSGLQAVSANGVQQVDAALWCAVLYELGTLACCTGVSWPLDLRHALDRIGK